MFRISSFLRHFAITARRNPLHFFGALSHTAYCGAIFMEGHGIYPVMAGIMGIFVTLELLKGE